MEGIGVYFSQWALPAKDDYIKLNLNQIDYILKTAEAKLSFLMQEKLKGKTILEGWIYFEYPDKSILADGTLAGIIKIFNNEPSLKQFISDLRHYKQILTLYPQIDHLIIFDPSYILGYKKIFSSHIPDEPNRRKDIKYIFYMMKDRIDMIRQITYYVNNSIDEIRSIEDVNKESRDLTNLNIPHAVHNNNIIFTNIDSVIYSLLYTYYKDLPAYKYITGKVLYMDFNLFLSKYPIERVVDYVKTNLFFYPDFAKVVINMPQYYPELYELGEMYIKFNLMTDEDKKGSYINLAHIIMSKPGKLTKEEKQVVFQYLLLADDYPTAAELRTTLFWTWAGYSEKPFEISNDVETFMNFLDFVKRT